MYAVYWKWLGRALPRKPTVGFPVLSEFFRGGRNRHRVRTKPITVYYISGEDSSNSIRANPNTEHISEFWYANSRETRLDLRFSPLTQCWPRSMRHNWDCRISKQWTHIYVWIAILSVQLQTWTFNVTLIWVSTQVKWCCSVKSFPIQINLGWSAPRCKLTNPVKLRSNAARRPRSPPVVRS